MRSGRAGVWLGAAALAAVTAFAYWNGLRSAFIFDDADSTVNNPSIHRLASWQILNPPHGGITASGRPLFNATLALNWAWTGPETWSYHAISLAGHVLAGLLLFGLARRTLLLVRFSPGEALGLSWAIALLWLLHPLQTESVTYIVQRTELMMGLFYLAVLYALVRMAEAQEDGRSGAGIAWGVAGALACLAGMLSKEVMVSAPLVALLYDRAYLGGSFSRAGRKRWLFWLALALTWIPLGLEVWANRDRGGTSGLDVGITPLAYWQTQGPAILHYLRLAAWPNPLILDYALRTFWLNHALAALPANLAVAALAAGALWLLWRAPRWGALAFAFFAILAPTSLVPGNRQWMAEHRMYLALAPLLAAAVIGIWRLAARRLPVALFATVVAAAIFVARVRARNWQYDHPEALWLQNLHYTPENQFALCNLGAFYYEQGRLADAESTFMRAAEAAPSYAPAESNMGVVLVADHKPDDAIRHLQRALQLQRNYYQAENNMGVALAALRRWDEAIAWYRRALALQPDYPDAVRNLKLAYAGEADAHFQAGLDCSRQGKWTAAIEQYRQALGWKPDWPAAYADIGNAWLALDDASQAIAALRRSVDLAPNSAECHYDYALALKAGGRRADALREYEAAVQLAPDMPEPTNNLAAALEEAGQPAQAIMLLREFLRRHPGSPLVLRSLSGLLRTHPENQ